MKKLYIFSTSLNPDVYINAIVHCANDKQFKTRRVELVTIFENSNEESKNIQKYLSTKKKIYDVLDDLASGKYNTLDGNRQPREVTLTAEEKEIYHKCKMRIEGILFTTIIYDNLKKEIEKKIEENRENKNENSNCIFDVSGERKYLLNDILFISLSNGFKNIYVFDMLRPPNFNQKELNLIHSLGDNEYKFRNLINDSPFVEESLAYFQSINNFGSIIEDNSTRFAQLIMFFALGVSTGLLLLLAKKTAYIQENWDTIEPLSFIVLGLGIVIVTYIINVILAITFQKELQLNPLKSFKTFKDYKRKRLNKKYNFKN